MNHPLYFPQEDPKLFAWLHEPATAGTAEVGLVICKPFGYEAICAHRSLRAFAEMAAAAGVPALRFDYSGTGDSNDADEQADQVDQWCNDIITAVGELRRRTGVRRVCLLGFRLGAMLATLAAQRCDGVDFLILVAPIISGRRYVGEMRTTSLAAALTLKAAAPANATPANRATPGDGSMEVSGHCVSAATIAQLSRIEFTTSSAPKVSRMLIIDRDDLPMARKWGESLSNLGLSADYAVMPGFVKMMMTPPQYTSIPHEIIGLARDWLLRLGASQPQTASAGQRSSDAGDLAIDQSTFLSIRDKHQSPDAALTERPVQFGSEAPLFGIVTEPRKGETRRRAVILVNAGADYHIATGRMYVSLARSWARRGYVVLRMDLAGLGDSGTRPDRPDNEVFPPAAVDDIRSATSLMRERYRAGDITVAGLCSGAYHALQAAANAVPLNRILLVNPETFWWRQGTTLEDIDPAAVVKTGSVYGERMRSWKHWKKLLTGQADVWWIAKRFLLRFALSLNVTAREILRYLNIRLGNDLGWELQRIAARGIQTTMVFSRGEPGIALLRMQAGSTVGRLGDRFRMHIIDNADHTFSRSASRAVLQEVLSDELFKRSGVA
jgi:alpha-beta hydrolase superfamily lysophospholipase